MIREEEVIKIGKLIKPHGINGEIAFAFDNDIFDHVDCPYLILEIEGILVPFFMEEYRFKGQDTVLVKFEDIEDENEARVLNGINVYFPKKYMEGREEEVKVGWNYFRGFSIIDSAYGNIGIIEDIDDNTMNVLFLVKNEENELIVPANEDFIEEIDNNNKILKMNLPEGLLS